MTMAKKNTTAKATQATLATLKKVDRLAELEWQMAFNTNNKRGKVWNQSEIMKLYGRERWEGHCGASKVCHTLSHAGIDFKHIVIKRHMDGGWIANPRQENGIAQGNKKVTGNQLIDEINCWQEMAETEDADLLCPIFKFFKSKSDKVEATSEKMQENVIIIAQKAVYIGDAEEACKEAERRNIENGFNGENRYNRYDKMLTLSEKMGWRDAMYNGGNSGVIFDYAAGCYKAVFIDYAL